MDRQWDNVKKLFKRSNTTYEKKIEFLDKAIEKDIQFFNNNYAEKAMEKWLLRKVIKKNKKSVFKRLKTMKI